MFPRIFPNEFLQIPEALKSIIPDPTDEEQRKCFETRKSFAFPQDRTGVQNLHPLHFSDYIRAFRALRGGKRYIEIGTYDKGNLGYLINILSDDAVIVDVDIAANQEQAVKLKSALKPRQTYHQIVGDSGDIGTGEQVRASLVGELADGIFIDGDHTSEAVLTDYALYSPLVKAGGLIMFHDVLWSGDSRYFGSSQAIEQIDKFSPVFVVCGPRAPYRFLPVCRKESPVWGGIGVTIRAKS